MMLITDTANGTVEHAGEITEKKPVMPKQRISMARKDSDSRHYAMLMVYFVLKKVLTSHLSPDFCFPPEIVFSPGTV